ncbi:MAG: hypothetical protein NHB14_19450 [Desulfosporosinus sp.]|nr:hypothetical protein [Desulfosporosinus sp.]
MESSHLCPEEFCSLLLSHGVTTAVADPHEIANVLGGKESNISSIVLKGYLLTPLSHFLLVFLQQIWRLQGLVSERRIY